MENSSHCSPIASHALHGMRYSLRTVYACPSQPLQECVQQFLLKAILRATGVMSNLQIINLHQSLTKFEVLP